jgi:hypothetical protein
MAVFACSKLEHFLQLESLGVDIGTRLASFSIFSAPLAARRRPRVRRLGQR